jgi:hypothetical protein
MQAFIQGLLYLIKAIFVLIFFAVLFSFVYGTYVYSNSTPQKIIKWEDIHPNGE